jgi:PIN domain nuclease of toxin-antitoxin system
VIVLDTAMQIWRGSDPKRLTTRARRAIDEAERVLVSAISVWEIAMLVAKRRIQLDRTVEQWAGVALALPGIQLAPLEPVVAVRRHQAARRFSP